MLNRFVPAAAPAAAKVSNGEIKDLQNRMAAVEDKLRKSASATANTAPKPQSETQKKVLYADNILGDTFNGVKEHASDDTIFQLTLTGPARAMVTLYENATRKVLANASYLEGCEKQLLGRSTVHIDRNGEAEKDENGRWRVKTRLKVVIR